jgi:hypothetical protein
MFELLMFIFSLETDPEPVAFVVVPYRDFEAIYLPADYTGPIVAIPSDEEVFTK